MDSRQPNRKHIIVALDKRLYSSLYRFFAHRKDDFTFYETNSVNDLIDTYTNVLIEYEIWLETQKQFS